MDPWTDRLSEYLDGDLSPGERSAVDAHLAGCAACRSVLAELQQVVRHAAALPLMQPPRDLWPDIAARLSPPAATHSATEHRRAYAAPAVPPAPAARTVSPDAPVRLVTDGPAQASSRQALRRRAYAFTVPQLAAAAVALMLFSGTAVWQLTGRAAEVRPGGFADAMAGGEPVRQSPADAVVLTGAGIEARYADAIGELEAALGEARGYLDPQTIATLEQSLVAVEAALEEARAALDADPGSAFLARHLENTTLRKLELLRSAGRMTVRT